MNISNKYLVVIFILGSLSCSTGKRITSDVNHPLFLYPSKDTIFSVDGQPDSRVVESGKQKWMVSYYESKKIKSKGQIIFKIFPTGYYITDTLSGIYKLAVNQTLEMPYHGFYYEWHENGQIKTVGYYHAGVEIGLWEFYDESGILTKEIEGNTLYINRVFSNAE